MLTPLQPILHAFVNKLFGLEGETVDNARFRGIIFSTKDFTTTPSSSDALNRKLLQTAQQTGYMQGNMFTVTSCSNSFRLGEYFTMPICPKPLWITKPILSQKTVNSCQLSVPDRREPATMFMLLILPCVAVMPCAPIAKMCLIKYLRTLSNLW